MARFTREQIEANLAAAITAGKIWNVDLEDMKYDLNKVVETAVKDHPEVRALDQILNEENGVAYKQYADEHFPGWEDSAYNWRAVSDGFRKSKLFNKAFDTMDSIRMANLSVLLGWCNKTDKLPKEPRWDVVRKALADIKPLLEMYATAKAIVVKGRKPAETPSENAWTPDNTGTCGCCGRRIKLNGTRIWDHGYSIEGRGRGYYSGQKVGASCFGAHRDAIEISSSCLVAILKNQEDYLANLPKFIKDLAAVVAGLAKPVDKNSWHMTKEEKDYADRYNQQASHLRDMRRDLKALPKEIEVLTERIADWQPTKLYSETPADFEVRKANWTKKSQ